MSDPAVIEVASGHDQADGRMVTGRFLIVTLATFAYFLALGSLLPTIPRYVEDELNGNGFAVGLVVGSFAVSAAVVRPWAGRIGDRYGRRVLLSGGALLVGLTTLAYTQVDAIPALVALRLITGIGRGRRLRRRRHRHPGHGARASAGRGRLVLQRGAVQRAGPRSRPR